MLIDPITIRAESATRPISLAREESDAWQQSSDTQLLNQEQDSSAWGYELADLPVPLALSTLGEGIPYHLPSANRRSLYELCKRVIDIAVSLCVLLFTLPLFAIVVILLKLSSPGAVFFKQKRLGRGGTEFLCFKFRTMYINAEEHLKQNPQLRQKFEESYKIKDDPRITPVGRLLRKTSMDELPQLLNVLRGEMTLIGPRPIVKPELSKYSIYGHKLLSVKPGLSGLWQVCGRSDVAYPERVLLDMHYIDHRCLSLDINLMLRTPLAIFWGHGAC